MVLHINSREYHWSRWTHKLIDMASQKSVGKIAIGCFCVFVLSMSCTLPVAYGQQSPPTTRSSLEADSATEKSLNGKPPEPEMRISLTLRTRAIGLRIHWRNSEGESCFDFIDRASFHVITTAARNRAHASGINGQRELTKLRIAAETDIARFLRKYEMAKGPISETRHDCLTDLIEQYRTLFTSEKSLFDKVLRTILSEKGDT